MEPHRQFFWEYAVMYRPYINQLNEQLSPFRLSVPLWSIMHLLFHDGPHTIGGISNRQNVEKPTITKMVQRLVELDIVEAQPGSDRRTRIIQLTDHGTEVFGQVREKISSYQESLVKDISEKELRSAALVLRKISRHF
ncbi:MAG TPA: MarR family transcriptional regulator [Bacillus bacterium]|uniref:HTH marR-type domain-containing protein n=1 Tax=Siminovitchia fordii TaxID=254759 RepID=A0ABQ4K823_9BACI|nr:MarR family transcriptional regulator [Siminovitchia fordii]GIN21871.1 hypothetical protein J1TS3_30050 [Siminovitchia fordii]HBZ11755.1 MarR family transcriptional regulator [Bacillus sp. (in: firmicutes)]